MLNIPGEVYEYNLMSYKRAATNKKCRHKKWYQWFFKPHYKTIRKLPKEKNTPICDLNGNTENLTPSDGNLIEASARSLMGSHESIPDFSTPVRRHGRKVRIDEVPYEIGTTSSHSGDDSTLIETPTTVRAKEGFSLKNNRRACEDSRMVDENADGDTTLLVPNSNPRNLEESLSNRDSFMSADDFQSVSSLISEEYAPSITTSSMKSVYYSLPSETSSLIQIWQPEGEACS